MPGILVVFASVEPLDGGLLSVHKYDVPKACAGFPGNVTEQPDFLADIKTITSRPELEKQLDLVAKAGYATVHGELEDGLNGIAVPVRGHHGTVIGAVSISGPSFRFKPDELPELIEELKWAGLKISENMGFRPVT